METPIKNTLALRYRVSVKPRAPAGDWLAVAPLRAARRRVLLARLVVLALLSAGQVTAQFTVTSTADSGPGTLRSALASAANGDTIDATGVSGIILLTSGELLVTNNVTILGPGPANLAVNGNASYRVFNISGSVVTIAGLTITNGKAAGGGFPANSGGGIFTGPGTLTVSNCALSANSAQFGGGIFNDGTSSGKATLLLSASTLTGNWASETGGGIYNNGNSGNAALTVSASTFISNSASGFGGGIYNDGYTGSAMLTVSVSTLSANLAGGDGGAIYNNGKSSGTGTVQIATSTLSGNLATSDGGGIYNDGTSGQATLTVKASTLSGNSAGGGAGGAIRNRSRGGGASVEIGSSILNAGASGGTIANFSGVINSDGHNLASDYGGGVLLNISDQLNSDPMLGPLQDNGGPTFTHALLPGSPAIDRGENLLDLTTDQRGLPRTVVGPCFPNALGRDGTDIGAFEVQQPCLMAVSLRNVRVLWPPFGFGFDLTGGSNHQVVVVEASTNLVNWTALVTNTLGATPLPFYDFGWTNFHQRFYRAQLPP